MHKKERIRFPLSTAVWLSLCLISISGCFIFPTNQRTACIYNLKEKGDPFGASDDSCNVIAYDLITSKSEDTEVMERGTLMLNFHILKCLEYYQKLKECKKEENYYIPTLHPQ